MIPHSRRALKEILETDPQIEVMGVVAIPMWQSRG
jgi:hypothetical protein